MYEERVLPLLDQYVGLVFEQVVFSYLVRMNKQGKLPILGTEFGTWWGTNPYKKQQEEIDCVVLSEKAGIFVECKYRNEPVRRAVLEKLIERSVLLTVESRYYMVFSKSGFTPEAEAFAKAHGRVELVGLEQMMIDVMDRA